MPSLVRRALLVLGLLVCAGSGGMAAAPSALTVPSLPRIPEVVSAGGVATLTLDAALDPSGRPAFFWQGQEVAPTIRVRPGDVIHLHYENHLPEICGLGLVSDSNLHFHGLTAAPTVHSDDVIATSVKPGKTFDYTLRIDRTQPPGLYWYHPHPHGLANWEIGNGMAGAIVVEGIADAVPQAAGLREQVIVLRDMPLDHSVAAAERLASLKVTGTSALPADADDLGPRCGVETTAMPTINGLPSATIGIRSGERQLWRILNASAERHYVVALTREPLQLVAQDGVPLAYAPGGPASKTVSQIVIPPAGRAEVLVTGTRDYQYLVSRCFDAGPGGDVNPDAIFAMTVDDRNATPMQRVAAPLGLRASPAYASISPPARYRTVHLSEDKRGFYVDRRAYDPAAPAAIVVHSGTTEEWTLVNETDEVHSFHIHQVHFVVAAVNGRTEKQRRWLDVVDVPPRRDARHPSTLKIVLDFRDPVIRGTFLFHCHIVDHEDQGMMAKIRVI